MQEKKDFFIRCVRVASVLNVTDNDLSMDIYDMEPGRLRKIRDGSDKSDREKDLFDSETRK